MVEIREGLHRELRAAVLGSGVPDLMASWTRTRWGADDLPMWRAAGTSCSRPRRRCGRSRWPKRAGWTGPSVCELLAPH